MFKFLKKKKEEKKKLKEQRYIKLDTSKSLLNNSEEDKNFAEKEFLKAQNTNVFYEHKKVDATEYFNQANKNTLIKKQENLENTNILPNNYYEKSFMEDENDYFENNQHKNYNFNPDVNSPKYYNSNMKDSLYRSSTDVEKLNKDFNKKYASKRKGGI